MKIQFAAATAAIALLAGVPAMAADPAFDPVLSVSGSNQNTTANPALPLQSRPGAVPSGERSNDPGEGMPPHSPGLAPTSYAPPPSSGPVYYPQPAYYVPAQPVYYAPAVATPVVAAPVAGASVGGLVGAEVTDMYGVRVGQVTDVQIMPDRRAFAIVGLGPWPGQVERRVALPLEAMHHSTAGRLAYNSTADQIRALPTF
ncbi:PRC-barrel domain-containing protein [Stella sp.]|uniref:PRC-barrel domain-containing protein n=1 Tax=Stella sp. TaxID=2912054 RepID=UPI0035B4BFAF